MQPAEDQQHIPTPRPPDKSAVVDKSEIGEVGAVPHKLEPVEPVAVELSDREQGILAFEGRWWKHAGAKEQAIRDTFSLSSTRYYQLLNAILDNPAAMKHDPVLVGRLRRLRSTRARTRRR
jgi:uncharacterized protein DUF3263